MPFCQISSQFYSLAVKPSFRCLKFFTCVTVWGGFPSCTDCVLQPNDAMKGMRFIPQPPVAVPTIPPSSNATTLTSAPIPFDASEEDVGSFVFRSAKEQVDSFAHILEQHTATASKRSAAKMIANYRSAEAILLHEPTGPSLSPASRAAVLDSPCSFILRHK